MNGLVISVVSFDGTKGQMLVTRLNSAGTVDPGFNGGQFIRQEFPRVGGPSGGGVRSIFSLSDGKVLAVGVSAEGLSMARYTNPGILDATFGVNGLITNSIQGFGDLIPSSIFNGQSIISGYRDYGDIALLKFGIDGKLDASFGVGGVASADAGGYESLSAISLQSDGKIVAVGSRNINGKISSVALRFMANGTIDGAFGFCNSSGDSMLGVNECCDLV